MAPERTGVPEPNYTQIPNVILDNMSQMSDAELRVVLAITRKTKGWHKDTDELSISQLMELTGLSNTAAIRGSNKGIERGIIGRTAIDESNNRRGYKYRLLVNESHKETFPLMNESHKPNKRKAKPLMNESHKAYERKSQDLMNESHIQKKEKESIKENGGGIAPTSNNPPPSPSKTAAADDSDFISINAAITAFNASLPDPLTGIPDLTRQLMDKGVTAAELATVIKACQGAGNPAGAFINYVKTGYVPRTRAAPKPATTPPTQPKYRPGKDGDIEVWTGNSWGKAYGVGKEVLEQ